MTAGFEIVRFWPIGVRGIRGWTSIPWSRDFLISGGLVLHHRTISSRQEGVRGEQRPHTFIGDRGTSYFGDLCGRTPSAWTRPL